MHFVEYADTRYECAGYSMFAMNREKIAHDETELCAMEKVMLSGRHYAAATQCTGKQKQPDEAKWAGSEERKRSLQKRVEPICSLSKEGCDRLNKREIITTTRL
jgi:hypothetical protein